jgi:transglutaminase-like putative cysteine protease
VVSRLRAALVPLALAGMLAVAGLTLARIYDGDLAGRLLVGAALGAVAVSMAVQRLPAWSAAPASLLGLAGYTLLAVRLSATGAGVAGPVPRLAGDALVNGIPRLLTATVPIQPQPDTVAVAVLATWLAGLAGAELALRARRTLLSYAAPVLLYAAALYVVGPNATVAYPLPLSFAALAAVGLAASAGDRAGGAPRLAPAQRATLRTRLAAGAGAALAAVIVLLAAVAPLVGARVDARPADPRRYVVPPRLDALDENPLARLSGWALNRDQHLFDVALSGPAAGGTQPVRLAVLSDYDGVTWRVGATYRSAGRVLTGAQPARPATLAQKITIAELGGRLLPAAAQPQRVDGVRVAYDPATTTLAVPEGLRPGLAYTVQSRPPEVDVNLLPSADVPSGAPVARFLALGPGLPAQLSRLAEQLSEGAGAPYQRAQAIEQFLAEHYQLVSDAPSGHAYPNLSFFLFGPRGTGGQRGTSEQFAAAFAVLGRAVGLPTRVAVGFRVRPGATEVRGGDAYAWPEVLFTGVGWVAFDPLPQPDTAPRPVEEDFKPKPVTSTPPPAPAPAASLSRSAAPPPAAAGPPGRAPAGPPRGPVAAAVAVLVLAGYLAGVPLLRRARRRRRLYTGPPANRVAGAWLEVLEALRLAGRPAPAYLTASEVAGRAAAAGAGHRHTRRALRAARPPLPALDDLAGLVNAVTFGPDGAVEDDARRAAGQALAYVGELRARRSWWRRLLWSADPRPLGWGRR